MNFIMLVFGILSCLPAFAEPFIIADNRLDEVSASVALGRGYGLGNNQIYANCFTTMDLIEPSFDLKYSFDSVREEYSDQWPDEVYSLASYKKSFVSFHARFHEIETDPNGQQRKIPLDNVLISLDLESYGDSFNEGNSPIQDSLITSLQKGDYSGFLQQCGSHFIRTMGRISSFVGLLTYRSLDTIDPRRPYSDAVFRETLQRLLAAFTDKAPIDQQFSKEMKERNLTFVTGTLGIDKDTLENIQVVPRNIDELRQTIRDLAVSMQDEDTGRISLIEAVSWQDHPDYFANLSFPNETVKDRYISERNYRLNNYIIGEIDRKDRAFTDLITRTNLCSRTLEEKYPEGRDEFSYDPEKTWFADLGAKGNIKKYKNLKELKSKINKKLVQSIQAAYDSFYLGTSDGQGGALGCLSALDGDLIFKQDYRTLESCLAVDIYRTPSLPIVDHYCLPELVLFPE